MVLGARTWVYLRLGLAQGHLLQQLLGYLRRASDLWEPVWRQATAERNPPGVFLEV